MYIIHIWVGEFFFNLGRSFLHEHNKYLSWWQDFLIWGAFVCMYIIHIFFICMYIIIHIWVGGKKAVAEETPLLSCMIKCYRLFDCNITRFSAKTAFSSVRAFTLDVHLLAARSRFMWDQCGSAPASTQCETNVVGKECHQVCKAQPHATLGIYKAEPHATVHI